MQDLYSVARTESWRRVTSAMDAENGTAESIKDAIANKDALERQIAKSKLATDIVESLIKTFGHAIEHDEEISGSDAVQELVELLSPALHSFKNCEQGKYDVMQGRFCFEGIEIVADFQAPSDATVAEKDAAFLAALAQQAEVDFLTIGTTSTT